MWSISLRSTANSPKGLARKGLGRRRRGRGGRRWSVASMLAGVERDEVLGCDILFRAFTLSISRSKKRKHYLAKTAGNKGYGSSAVTMVA